MTEDMKLVLKVIIPIIILLIILCVYSWDKWTTITVIFGFIFCCALGLLDIKDKIGMSETQTYTTVEDKYMRTRGKITNYYAKVKVGDYKELEEVQITSEQYEAIGKGSKILCTVYLKNDKILDVEFAEVHGKE